MLADELVDMSKRMRPSWKAYKKPPNLIGEIFHTSDLYGELVHHPLFGKAATARMAEASTDELTKDDVIEIFDDAGFTYDYTLLDKDEPADFTKMATSDEIDGYPV